MTMGTNKQVFSIVGPHTGTNYGDIVIVLSQSVMYHPDFSMTPTAATTFHSTYEYWLWFGTAKDHRKSGKGPVMRPWDNGSSFQDARSWFNASKINAAIDGWDLVTAAELQAMASLYCNIQGAVTHYMTFGNNVRAGGNANLSHVQQYYLKENSHYVMEGHLPSVVPFDFVERMLIPEGLSLIE